jgi:hypothetical protein
VIEISAAGAAAGGGGGREVLNLDARSRKSEMDTMPS